MKTIGGILFRKVVVNCFIKLQLYFMKIKYAKRFVASTFCQYPIPNKMEFDNPVLFIGPFYFIASKHKK